MKNVLIGIGIAIVVAIIVWFALPQGAKDYLTYFKIQTFDSTTYGEIEKVQNAVVLNQPAYTYQSIMEENTQTIYWTYKQEGNTTIVTANGGDLTLVYGESGDSGVCQDSKLMLEFTLDDKGGYNLAAYVDKVKLSNDDRDRLLAAMCK